MQGFNMGRYYPPSTTSPPRFNTSSSSKKLTTAPPTVRFELPFAVWCTHCAPHAIVGQGVRFNATKKKVGNYYSTPIWSFRVKHTTCGGWWEIRTDPERCEYVVVEGARRRDYGPDDKGVEGEDGEDLRFLTEEEKRKRKEDAFAAFEGKTEEKGRERGDRERIEDLLEAAEVARDDWGVNARMRRVFRGDRKVLQGEERGKEKMQERFSLGMEIVGETEGDRVRAGLVEFGAAAAEEESVVEGERWKPLFPEMESGAVVQSSNLSSLRGKKLKAEVKAERSRAGLQQTLVSNSRASIDPFLSAEARSTQKKELGILKRKRGAESEQVSTTNENATTAVPKDVDTVENKQGQKAVKKTALLVGYDSD
jgi:coiled-coil domain-containing protein 130